METCISAASDCMASAIFDVNNINGSPQINEDSQSISPYSLFPEYLCHKELFISIRAPDLTGRFESSLYERQ